jgi:hypothetical protein
MKWMSGGAKRHCDRALPHPVAPILISSVTRNSLIASGIAVPQPAKSWCCERPCERGRCQVGPNGPGRPHAFLHESNDKGLKLAQLLDQLGVYKLRVYIVASGSSRASFSPRLLDAAY